MVGQEMHHTDARAKGPAVRTSVCILIVGALIAIPGVVVMVIASWDQVTGPTYDVPTTLHLGLHEGTYIVFENTSTSSSYGPLTISHGHGVTIDAAQVTVRDDDGAPVPVRNSEPNESIGRDSATYVAAVEFTTPHAGDYVVRLATNAHTRVMVEPPLGDLFRSHVPWLISTGIGWLVAALGAWMLILGSVRRGRAARAAERAVAASMAAPPQWYADPYGTHRLRYWDGWRWTDHTSD